MGDLPSPFPHDPDEGIYPEKFAKAGLTFDDVLLVPAESAVIPSQVDTRTRLTKTLSAATVVFGLGF